MKKLLTFWEQDYRLDRMGLKELWVAYFMHHTIQVYLLLAAASIIGVFYLAEDVTGPLAAAAVALLLYPFVWYGLHRYVLHGKFLYRFPQTAKVWKRIHFDHHRDPHDLKVLFGALYTTLPTIALATMPVGFMMGGVAGLPAAFAAGLLATCFYEFCHCIQHLNYTPRLEFLKRMKKLHLQHHFHDENGNYGITNFIPDRLFGTYQGGVKGRPKSDTVFNLGYTGAEVRRFPWVARLTPDLDEEKAVQEGVDRRKPLKKKAA